VCGDRRDCTHAVLWLFHGRVVVRVIFNLVIEVLLLRSSQLHCTALTHVSGPSSVTEVNDAVVLYYFKSHNDHCNRNVHNETL